MFANQFSSKMVKANVGPSFTVNPLEWLDASNEVLLGVRRACSNMWRADPSRAKRLAVTNDKEGQWPPGRSPMLVNGDHPFTHMLCHFLDENKYDAIESLLKSCVWYVCDLGLDEEIIPELLAVAKEWDEVNPIRIERKTIYLRMLALCSEDIELFLATKATKRRDSLKLDLTTTTTREHWSNQKQPAFEGGRASL